MYGQVTFNQDAKTIQWGKESLFNKWCWENWTPTCKRIKLDPYTIYKNSLKIDQ